MSLQDKISSAKPTTFLTDGLSEEEVKQAVDEGRKRTDTVKLIIEIPKAMYENVQKKTYCGSIYPYLEKAIPLDDVKAEIDEQYDRVRPYNIDVAEGLEMALEILDNIGKAESEE